MIVFELHDPQFLPHTACELTFSLKEGEALVLVGENGIGKTTLLRRIYGRFGSQAVSFVEQSPLNVFFDRSVDTVKDIFRSLQDPKFDRSSFEYLWKEFGLDQKGSRTLSHLSGGELQSLKLCLILSKEAPIYLLDEPSQYLDDKRKEILATYLKDLLAKQKFLVIVEHDRGWFPPAWTIQELLVINRILQKGRAWNT